MKANRDAGGDAEEGKDHISLHGPRGSGYNSFSAFPSPSEALKRHRHTGQFPSLLLIVGGNMERRRLAGSPFVLISTYSALCRTSLPCFIPETSSAKLSSQVASAQLPAMSVALSTLESCHSFWIHPSFWGKELCRGCPKGVSPLSVCSFRRIHSTLLRRALA